MANSVDPDQTAPIGAVCSGSTLFASILNSSEMLGNYLQQTTLADDIFKSGDKKISILHSPCRTSDLQFLLVLQTHALVLKNCMQ